MLARKNNSRLHNKKIKPDVSRHCLGTIVVKDSSTLFDGQGCVDAIKEILYKNGTTDLGEQLHEFPNKSFTLLVALAESHISIHTWPEKLSVQLDVFLCNYLHNNTEKCENIYKDIVTYFDPQEVNTTILERP